MSEQTGGHDWCAFLVVPLTDKELRRVVEGQRVTFKNVDPTSGVVRSFYVGCMTCEHVLGTQTDPCPGEPSGYTTDGDPYWGEPPADPQESTT